MKRISSIVLAALLPAVQLLAQSYVTGSIESNSIQYAEDKSTGAILPVDRFGSNNYAKVDAYLGNFSAGMQIEGYMPALQGYPSFLDGVSMMSKYVAYSNSGWNVRLGNFYGQFGSGLLFRSWEDRDLGFNNSLEGIDVAYSWNDALSVRGICGRPRVGMSYNPDWVRGADLNISPLRAFGVDVVDFDLGASYIDRYQDASSYLPEDGIRSNVNGLSYRAGLGWNGLSLNGEYVTRQAEDIFPESETGKAYVAELAYSGHGLGVTATFRKMKNMVFYMEREDNDGLYHVLNYTPALTQQYTYSLTTMNPYFSHPLDEVGGQVDISYNFRRNTLFGGKRGLKIHANYSEWHGPENAFFGIGDDALYFRDASIDFDKSLSKSLKLKGLYSFQSYNPLLKGPSHLGEAMWNSHIVVLDLLWKIDKKQSLRSEFQHLATKKNIVDGQTEYNRYRSNWVSGLVEYNLGSKWSVYVQDSWNYGNDEKKMHYYNGGASWSGASMRADLSFGRYMQGYICSGGVCRTIPAYTGANLKFTFIF